MDISNITVAGPRLELRGADDDFRALAPDLFGLGAIDKSQAYNLGTTLAQKTHGSSGMFFRASDLAAALQSFSAEDREQIIAAYIAGGGDLQKLAEAQKLLAVTPPGKPITGFRKVAGAVWGVAGTISMVASVYHGYKRNDSLGWALVWGLMAGLFPVVTPVVAVAQGYAKPKHY